jgi:exodeoxyribonuclease VII small subunit
MSDKTDKKFEPSFRKLERIVGRLESDSLDLEESLKLYEEGVALSRFCSKVLEQAEKKVQKLARDENGELSTEDLELPDLQGKAEL